MLAGWRVPVWRATHRQDIFKERTGIDVGTHRLASSRKASLGSLNLIDTPCFPLSKSGRVHQKVWKCLQDAGRSSGSESQCWRKALSPRRIKTGKYRWGEEEYLPLFKIFKCFRLLEWSWNGVEMTAVYYVFQLRPRPGVELVCSRALQRVAFCPDLLLAS